MKDTRRELIEMLHRTSACGTLWTLEQREAVNKLAATEALGQPQTPLLAGQSPVMDRESVPACEPSSDAVKLRLQAIDNLHTRERLKYESAEPCVHCDGKGSVPHPDGREASRGRSICILCQGLGIKGGWDNPVGLVVSFSQDDIDEEVAAITDKAQPPTPESAIDAVKVREEWTPDMAFVADNWANVAYNGLQHLRNLKDGIGTIDTAIENMDQCCVDAQANWQLAMKSSALPSHPAAPQQALSDEEIHEHLTQYWREPRDGWKGTEALFMVDELVHCIRALLQKSGSTERDAKDAERYRVLRDDKYQMLESDVCVADDCFASYFGEGLDAEVDALKARYDALSPQPSTDAKPGIFSAMNIGADPAFPSIDKDAK